MKTEQGEIPALFSCREAWGLARRLRRGRRACSPMGRSIVSGGDPKVSKGERREASIQWIQPPKAVSDPEFRQTTSGTHGSAGRADCLPRGKPPARSAERFPCGGLTRRLRRGLGLAVPRSAHTFLSVAKEKCAKESQRHGDSRGGPPRCALRASSCGSPFGAVLVLGSLRSPAGKKPFIAHF